MKLNKRTLVNAINDPGKAGKKLLRLLFETRKKFPSNPGYCVICKTNTSFIEYGEWLRDDYRCIKCNTKPRQRAFISVLNQQFPNWRGMKVHESSPHLDIIKKECIDYSASQFYPGKKLGERYGEFTCEDLSRLTFPDESFDLLLTQDVFEHVINPEPAFAEIARVLKPGGAHVFTMPWYPELQKTVIRAKEVDNEIVHMEEPVYHGNPISDSGSLVTRDWGLDFPEIIFRTSGLMTTIQLIRDKSLGIDGKFLEVFICRKANEQT